MQKILKQRLYWIFFNIQIKLIAIIFTAEICLTIKIHGLVCWSKNINELVEVSQYIFQCFLASFINYLKLNTSKSVLIDLYDPLDLFQHAHSYTVRALKNENSAPTV